MNVHLLPLKWIASLGFVEISRNSHSALTPLLGKTPHTQCPLSYTMSVYASVYNRRFHSRCSNCSGANTMEVNGGVHTMLQFFLPLLFPRGSRLTHPQGKHTSRFTSISMGAYTLDDLKATLRFCWLAWSLFLANQKRDVPLSWHPMRVSTSSVVMIYGKSCRSPGWL